jgi:hypothetical protein
MPATAARSNRSARSFGDYQFGNAPRRFMMNCTIRGLFAPEPLSGITESQLVRTAASTWTR